MSATQSLLRGIKSALRVRKLTYRQLAQAVGVSEATIKRDLSRGHFSLRRLDQICEALELTLNDLTVPIGGADVLTQLSEAQEVALAGHPKTLVITYLLVNDWTFQEIISAFRMDENELVDVLLRLDKLKIIDFRPPHRIRKLTARNFSWRTDGPVHEFFVTRFAPEFFRSTFDEPGDAFRFAGGLLSTESLTRFKASLERLAAEFEELARKDAKLSAADREGCSAVLAVRSWEFSEITRMRRPGSPKGGPRSR
ncbi:MAG: helix-turn-helix transcriptional regulator [Pseudomonadota bacterium]